MKIQIQTEPQHDTALTLNDGELMPGVTVSTPNGTAVEDYRAVIEVVAVGNQSLFGTFKVNNAADVNAVGIKDGAQLAWNHALQRYVPVYGGDASNVVDGGIF